MNFLFAWNTENNNACENDQHALYVAPHNEIHMCTSAMLCMITGPCSFEYLHYSILVTICIFHRYLIFDAVLIVERTELLR